MFFLCDQKLFCALPEFVRFFFLTRLIQVSLLYHYIALPAEAYYCVYKLLLFFRRVNEWLLFYLVCLFLPCIDFLNYWQVVKAKRHRCIQRRVDCWTYLIKQDKTLFPTYRDELQ